MRRIDWQIRFAAFCKGRERMPFAWGSNDCCLFAADAVLAMTDSDCAAAMRGYNTARAALRIVREQGGMRQLGVRAWGEPVAPVMAAVGDPVLVLNGRHQAFAVCNGTTALGAGKSGIAVVGMHTALAAWKI